MRILFLLLFFLSAQAFAGQSYPKGMFKIDTENSRMVLFEKIQEIEGHLDLDQNKFIVHSDGVKFESRSMSGDDNDLTMKGILTYEGVDRPVILKGRFLGKISELNGEMKAAFRFSNEEISLRLFASKPTKGTKNLYRIVDQIVDNEDEN